MSKRICAFQGPVSRSIYLAVHATQLFSAGMSPFWWLTRFQTTNQIGLTISWATMKPYLHRPTCGFLTTFQPGIHYYLWQHWPTLKLTKKPAKSTTTNLTPLSHSRYPPNQTTIPVRDGACTWLISKFLHFSSCSMNLMNIENKSLLRHLYLNWSGLVRLIVGLSTTERRWWTTYILHTREESRRCKSHSGVYISTIV